MKWIEKEQKKKFSWILNNISLKIDNENLGFEISCTYVHFGIYIIYMMM